MTIVLIRLILAGLFWCAGVTLVSAEERLALVVGNSAYERVEALDNPINDALDMSVALEGLGFDVILGSDLDMDRMHAALEEFEAAADSADVVLFYYAGHGFQVSGQNYLVPVDATLSGVEDLPDQTVPLSDILEVMERASGVKLVFLDACRDNPFGVGLDEIPGMGSGLARAGTEADFMFVYATQPNNVAYDGTGRNSFFTEALLNHIYTPGQDIAELMISVRRDVLAATGGRQVPWENSSLTRQVQFDRSPVTASEETLLWQVAADMGDPALMELYAEQFPQGAHVGDVTAFLETGGATRTLARRDETAAAERLWNLARRSRLRPLLEYYLERYPDGADAPQARRLLQLIPKVEDSSPGSLCERLTTHPRDATAVHSGVPFERLQGNALTAIQACSAAASQSPELPHYIALLARATAAAGDLDRAVRLYRSAADRGDLRAMVSLAQLNETGTGVPQDVDAAYALYERAAKAGSPDAMINLAVSLFQGDRGAPDPDRAVALLRRAAEAGSPKAVFNLGVLAQDGVIDTPEAALDHFLRAARDGETQGYRAAAILLDEGRGVRRDPERAAEFLLRGVAEDNGTLLAHLTQSKQLWSRDTLSEVQAKLKKAGYYTAMIDGLSGPNFTSALKRWRNGGFKAEVLAN